jgi:preprotein translocase subunit SecG
VIYLVYALHILVCVFLILVVLLQQGKGADLSVFGGGSTQTAFGARGATTFLHKLTVASFIIFVLTTLALGLPKLGGTTSVLHGTAAGSASGKQPAGASQSKPATSPNRPGATPATPAAGTAAPAGKPVAPGQPAQAPPAAPAAKPAAAPAGTTGSAPSAPPPSPPSPPPH